MGIESLPPTWLVFGLLAFGLSLKLTELVFWNENRRPLIYGDEEVWADVSEDQAWCMPQPN